MAGNITNAVNKANGMGQWAVYFIRCLCLPLISKVTTSIGLKGQLYRNSKMSNLNFMVQMSKEFSISSLFEPIDVVILCTIWFIQFIPPTSSFFFLLYEISVVFPFCFPIKMVDIYGMLLHSYHRGFIEGTCTFFLSSFEAFFWGVSYKVFQWCSLFC